MRKDEFSTALILREVELKNWIPLKTTGNANCMFNAASLLLVGNKSLSDVIRLLIAGELFCFSEFYIQTIQDRFLEIENEMPYSEATAFSTITGNFWWFPKWEKKQEIRGVFLGFGCNFPNWENAIKTNIGFK